MFAIEANGQTIEAKRGETILQSLKRAGINVPTICHMEGLLPSGTCRMCVVEVEGYGGLIPSCSYPVAEGMKIRTNTPDVMTTRKTIIDLLLSNHPDDCLYCARNGNCDLAKLAADNGVRERSYQGGRNRRPKDISSPSIIRDPDKCILCGKCVRMCDEIQGVSAIDFIARGSKAFIGTAFNQGLNVSSCINCGQCILVCPTAALSEHKYVNEVLQALADPDKVVVVQHAPAVSVTIAEEFGFAPGTDFDGKMTAALRRVGFDRVFDTSFTADLTIMEEGSELVDRVQNGGALPMFTSCSPGWVKFVEEFYPEFLPNVSTCKSPQQMMGAIIKSFFAQKEKIDPKNIVSVSLMPCTAKKFECGRPEMGQDFVADVDYVLTTRELAELFRITGVNPAAIEPEAPDTPFGERSSAGKLFGASGGVMEAALRSAVFLLTGEEMQDYTIQALRGMEGSKELRVKVGDLEVGAAVVSSLGQARKLMDEIKAGRKDIHFIEVMTCPGGCINGGGQPIGADKSAIQARMAALYQIDSDDQLRVSHKNEWVQRLYKEFLGKPLGHKSHELLHTHYDKREVLL
ncbi:MAG: iron hydrogenase small subunit [Holophagaceae bacterium]|uniref:Iron hydrogenase small subunit n=1 Tax=Candidatus Geothrix skivensis TaxID=2954439 RepID=A0A9D7SKA9_9BACT|nr:iron hydrogenase small subunit [Candidatus Geothrix skivensis]